MTAPIIIVVWVPLRIIKKIRFGYIQKNYDSYNIFGATIYVNRKFAEQIQIPDKLKTGSGKNFKSAPYKRDMVNSYTDFERLGFSKEHIEGLREENNK